LPQEEKISHALSALLVAEVPEGSPLVEYKAALNFIVVAWNICLLDAERQSDAIHGFTTAIAGSNDAIGQAARGHIERLIARKQESFPLDDRTIVSWDVWFQGNSIRVSAAALAKS
jgi:hypothetical protein